MNIKTYIKNSAPDITYILPFARKELASDDSKAEKVRKVFELYKNIKPVHSKKAKRNYANDFATLLDEIEVNISKEKRFIYFIDESKTLAVGGNVLGNFSIDYEKVVTGRFDDLFPHDPQDDFERKCYIVGKAVERFSKKIYMHICNQPHQKNFCNKKEEFAHMCDRPAVHFEEALQRILFFNQLMWQTRHRLNGLGRLDKILYPIYKLDLDNGVITVDGANKIVIDFLESLSSHYHYKSDSLLGDIGQIIILGGLNKDGSYLCNDLTYIFLKAQAEFKHSDPKVFLRVSQKTPRELMEVATKALLSQTGSPLFSNDDIVIPAIQPNCKDGDEYNYCVSACWEPFIVGKSFDQNNIDVFDYFKVFDQYCNNYGQKRDGAVDFSSFLRGYLDAVRSEANKFIHTLDELVWAEDEFVSLFTEGCVLKHRDVSEGGAQYNNYGITSVGLAEVVSSICYLKKYVFDEKKFSFYELNSLRMRDYQNHKDILEDMKTYEVGYGVDEDLPVKLSNTITEVMSKVILNYKNKYGGTVKIGVSSPSYIARSGNRNADFSGKKSGTPYTTHISRNGTVYTELVNFASGLQYTAGRFNGNVVDFFISPSFVRKNFSKFVDFMCSAIKKGYFQMQMNVIDSKTLIAAKANPENYKDLIVRVWGFSAYFNDLPESYKDTLISRAIASEQ